MQIGANGLFFEIEDEGSEKSPVVFLIAGFGQQLTAWPAYFLQPLRAAGFRVIRMDNRDMGLSVHLDALGAPNLAWLLMQQKMGRPAPPPYTLQDMAQDSLAVLDALSIERAHVLGMSMGGMIAQRMALTAPRRLFSLTSIMSSSGAKNLPLGNPVLPATESLLNGQSLADAQRSFYPIGLLRQLAAVMCDTDRAEALSRITAPTLVVHGTEDPLLPLACGQDTQRRIVGAQLMTVAGMGHELTEGLMPQVMPRLLAHLQGNSPAQG